MSESESRLPQDLVNLMDFEAVAAGRLGRLAYDYFRSGADDELALARNRSAWDAVLLRYRVLVDVSACSARTSLLGEPLSFPVLVAPTAFHRLACPDGELATVRAAGAEGTTMILSTLSTTPLEEVTAAATGPVWFQLYVYRDRGVTEALVRRAEAAGCTALVLTVDAPVLGRRERDVRNRFTLPSELSLQNLLPAGYTLLPDAPTDSGLAAYFASLIDPALSFADLAWLCRITSLPIVVKGIVRADDALRALGCGAAGVVVSNHGGRQLDAAPPTAAVLPGIVQAVAGAGRVLVDGGVRRGTDVVRALALGADAVLLGRPVLWGLAAAGEAGARRVLQILREDVVRAMALCGCPDVASVDADLLHR